MKRIVALILALAVVFVLCGCGMVKEDVKLKYGEKYTVEAESLDDYLPRELQQLSTKEGYLQLIPGVHRCDGFFIARFRKEL